MPATGKITFNRVLVIIMLVMLVLQFELGMTVNLTPNLPSLTPFSFSTAQVLDALRQAGPVAPVHAIFGGALAIVAILTLIASLASGVRGAQIFGTLGFIAIFLAAYTGLTFVLSGFQNDGLSHGMATNFILAVVFYFLELYTLKPLPKSKTA